MDKHTEVLTSTAIVMVLGSSSRHWDGVDYYQVAAVHIKGGKLINFRSKERLRWNDFARLTFSPNGFISNTQIVKAEDYGV